MKTFALKTLVGTVAVLAVSTSLLYFLDLPFHYTPLLPLFFTIVCFERHAARRIAAAAAGGVVFFFLGHELPLLFVVVMFFQLYFFVRAAFTVTTFDFLVVLFFALFFSCLIVSADFALYRSAFTGSFPLGDLVFSASSNFGWLVLLFLFYRSELRELFVRSAWL